jgi:rubrerythrin
MGFGEVYNLEGGIRAWQGDQAGGPEELNLDLIRGDETSEEILSIAYCMENALQAFYVQMRDLAEDPEMRDSCEMLANFEIGHKKKIYDLSVQIEPQGKSQTAFEEACANSAIMEGGFDMAEFMDKNAAFLETREDVIELAMMLEAQALDLYLRFANKSTQPETKAVLFEIADEEKKHLSSLGRIMEKK